MEKTEKKKWFKNFKMPHTYVILVCIMVLMLVLTHIICGRVRPRGGPRVRQDGGCGRHLP